MNIDLQCIKIFIKIENILGFARLFVMWSIPVKVFLLIRLLAELVLMVYTLTSICVGYNLIQPMISYFLTFSPVLLSCYHSKALVKFLERINSNHIHYKSDNVYRSRLNMQFKFGICVWCGYCVSLFGVVLAYFIKNDVNKSVLYIFMFNEVLKNLRFHLEFLIQYYLLNIISEQLHCIIRSVEKEHTNSPKKFEEWRISYLKITKSVKLFNEIYSIQITMSFFAFGAHYVSLFYGLISAGVKGMSTSMDYITVISVYLATLFALILIIMMARAAQNLQNNASKLTRGLRYLLARMCSLAGNTEHKVLTQFLRIVSTQTISIKTFAAVNVNMTVIPACAAFIVSYTIVALQFNNVV